MTKTQQITNGLQALGWTIDTNGRTTKGTTWKGGCLCGADGRRLHANESGRLYQNHAGGARFSTSGRKADSLPVQEKQISLIIAAGEAA